MALRRDIQVPGDGFEPQPMHIPALNPMDPGRGLSKPSPRPAREQADESKPGTNVFEIDIS